MEAPGVPRLSRLTTTGLLAGPFLTMLDSNVVNVAVPDIARSVHAPLSNVQWTVSGYLLALGTALAASAYLERRFGSRHLYAGAMVAFTIASAACVLAPGLPLLIAARFIQGVAGAPLVPVAMNMLMNPSSDARRQIPAAAGILLFLAPAAGPTVGGVLIGAFGWQSIFLINVPFGVVGVAGALRLPAGVAQVGSAGARLDVLGLALLAAGLGFAFYGSGQGPVAGWLAPRVWPFWSAGALLLVLYVVRARRVAHPVLRLNMLHDRQAALALGLASIADVVLFSVLFLVPVYLQVAQHVSPFDAGVVLLPQGAVMGVSMAVTASVVTRGRVRETAIIGMIVLVAATVALLTVGAATPLWLTALLLGGRGLAIGLVVQPLLAVMLARVPRAELADANNLFNVAERLTGSFGIALLGTAFAAIGLHAIVIVLVGLAFAGLAGSLFIRNQRDVAISSLESKAVAA
ncbi:MAG: DHA2 family efflux MFS transporter permease subunit [Candidatus Dormibacteraeota bacterium]|nr:DHA2 family efflux MFS transporter permease subunit [Candidatus Dormibacteraeota bacterium]